MSARAKIVLNNPHGISMGIAAISRTGNNPNDFFLDAGSCGSSLAAHTSCRIDVRFQPMAMGTRSALILLDDEATPNPHPQLLSLKGIGK